MLTGGDEFTVEAYFHDYKKMSGAMVPQKSVVNRDGKLFLESEATEYTRSEKLDDALFTKP